MDTGPINRQETATIAGGCFWCTEAIFKRLTGVISVTPGYSGGNPSTSEADPTYEEVCKGTTGHAEAIQIEFNSKIISYEKLLEVFFALHDPTTQNRQGNDVGSQYRSVIFYNDEKQEKVAQTLINKLEKSSKYNNKIVTEIVPLTIFYKAENYHQNYFNNNRTQPYCQIVIDPKINKLLEEFKPLVSSENI